MVLDADDAARTVSEPGRPAWRALCDAFGGAVVRLDGSLDRTFVADIVFHDPSALARLNRITHHYIGDELRRELDAHSLATIFVALPLFRPEHREMFNFDEVWAMLVQPETAIHRLQTYRGFEEADARARLAAQPSNPEREAVVDRVIWNEGSLDELYARVDEAVQSAGLLRG